jgi:PPK2 family polyphosphate:nucleotide phosphotransferase
MYAAAGSSMAYAITVEPGTRVDLSKISPNSGKVMAKAAGEAAFASLAEELGELQELLYAAGTHGLLAVFQGMDTSGKDGAIRNVFKEVDPQGCRVASFKVPTPVELAHDFLWRVHHHAPERGMITVFNRSHYEDVVTVRVKELAPEEVWRARFDHINAFERLLTDSGIVIAKFFLHISEDEQEKRLLEREQEVEKAWKLSAGDWVERRSWDAYQSAYAEALTRCSTKHAPWYVVPANRKWFRNLAVAETLVELLRPLKAGWLETLEARGRDELAKIRAARPSIDTGDNPDPSGSDPATA